MPNGFYERLGNQNSRTLILRRSLGMFYKPFYRYGSHIEFIWFKEYYGMPRGALFGQKENFTVCFSGKRRSLLHLNTAQRSFFPLQSFSRKTSRKIGSKSARIQLFREKLSEKVHATMPKGIVGGLHEFTVLQRNLQEWHERPWTYVYNC